jgi:hypothetical protein
MAPTSALQSCSQHLLRSRMRQQHTSYASYGACSEGVIAWWQAHPCHLSQQLQHLVGVVHVELGLAGTLTNHAREYLAVQQQQQQQ